MSTLNKNSCSSLQAVLNGIIFEEWYELFEISHKDMSKYDENFHEIINRRLVSRRYAQQAFLNIIKTKMDPICETTYETILVIANLSETVISKHIQNIKIEANFNILNMIRDILDKIEAHVFVELGGLAALIELIQVIWNFDFEKSDFFVQLTLIAVKILNNLIKNIDISLHQRWLLNALKKCLSNKVLVLDTTILLSNLSKIDPRIMNDLDFSEIYVNLISNKKFDLVTIKTVLIMLHNLSLFYPSKIKICEKITLNNFVNLFSKSNEKLDELSLKFLKSISNHLNNTLTLELFKILSETLLKSSNLALVSASCEVLWLLVSKIDKAGCEELIGLDIDTKIKSLINSTNEFISSCSLAIVKILYSNGDFSAIKQESEVNIDIISSPSRLSMSSSLLSSSSSSSNSAILTNRHKKHVIEEENELIKKLNLSSDSSESISSSGSSSSNDTYYLNDSDRSLQEIQKEIKIQVEEIKCKSIIKTDNKNVTKHVTFNMDINDEIFIEIDASSTESLNRQKELISLNYKPESLVYLNFLNRSRRYQEKKVNTNLSECRSVSPIPDKKFLKATKFQNLNTNRKKNIKNVESIQIEK